MGRRRAGNAARQAHRAADPPGKPQGNYPAKILLTSRPGKLWHDPRLGWPVSGGIHADRACWLANAWRSFGNRRSVTRGLFSSRFMNRSIATVGFAVLPTLASFMIP